MATGHVGHKAQACCNLQVWIRLCGCAIPGSIHRSGCVSFLTRLCLWTLRHAPGELAVDEGDERAPASPSLVQGSHVQFLVHTLFDSRVLKQNQPLQCDDKACLEPGGTLVVQVLDLCGETLNGPS
jgi:hypothetical protein